MPTGDDVSTTRLSTVEFRVYAGLAVLMLGGALGYGIWTSWEPAGTALLFLGAGLFTIVAAYLWFSERLALTEASPRRRWRRRRGTRGRGALPAPRLRSGPSRWAGAWP